MVIKENDLAFLKEVVIPNLSLRGQKEKFFEVIGLAATAQWVEGMRALIESQKWTEANYQKYAKFCIADKKPALLKAIIHEMNAKKINLNLAEPESGNTLLHEAVSSGNEEIVSLLIGMGYDTTLKNSAGFTPEALSTQLNLDKVTDVFKKLATSGKQGTGNDPQIQLLQNEVQELKYQLAQLQRQADQQKQHNEETKKFYQSVVQVGIPFFNALKENYLEKGLFLKKPTHKFKSEKDLSRIMLLPSGNLLTELQESGELELWYISQRKCIKTERNSDKEPVTFWHDFHGEKTELKGKEFYTYTRNSFIVEAWDAASLSCIKRYHLTKLFFEGEDGYKFITLIPEEDKIILSKNQALHIFQMEPQNQQKKSKNQSSNMPIIYREKKSEPIIIFYNCEARKIKMHKTGKLLTFLDKTISILDTGNGNCIQKISNFTETISDIELFDDGKFMSLGGYSSYTSSGGRLLSSTVCQEIKIFEFSKNMEAKCIFEKTELLYTDSVIITRIISNELISITYENRKDNSSKIVIFDINKQSEVITFNQADAVCALPNNGLLLAYRTRFQPGKLQIFDPEDKTISKNIGIREISDEITIKGLVVLPDSRILTLSQDNEFAIWDNPILKQVERAESYVKENLPECKMM